MFLPVLSVPSTGNSKDTSQTTLSPVLVGCYCLKLYTIFYLVEENRKDLYDSYLEPGFPLRVVYEQPNLLGAVEVVDDFRQWFVPSFYVYSLPSHRLSGLPPRQDRVDHNIDHVQSSLPSSHQSTLDREPLDPLEILVVLSHLSVLRGIRWSSGTHSRQRRQPDETLTPVPRVGTV